MRVAVVVCALLVANATFADDRPQNLVARATPGLGYAWDVDASCEHEGRMFVGGFSVGYVVAPGLVVGGNIAVTFNTLGVMQSCGANTLRLATAVTLGPSIEWYPRGDGLHIVGAAGYAAVDQDDGITEDVGHGVGAIAAVGYDWLAGTTVSGVGMRFGVRFQVTTHQTFTAGLEHFVIVPALMVILGLD